MTKLATADVIKYSAYEVMNNGYTKRSDKSDSHCTADKVFDNITKDLVSDEQLETAKEYIASWLDYINSQTGEYFENVQTAIGKPQTDETKIGLIASSFASFDKYKSFGKAAENEKLSDYLGEEGDTVTFKIKDHRLVKSGNSKFGNGNSSKWFLYKLHDTSNNVVMWFADHDSEFEFKHSHKATGTISKLSVYNDVKQTSISKLKFLDD